MKTRKVNTKLLHYLYIPVDFIVSMAVNVLAFLSCLGLNQFLNHIVPVMIFTGIVSILLTIVLLLIKTYRMLTHNFGLGDAIRMMVVVFSIQLTAFFVAYFLPNDILLTESGFIWCWILSTIALIFIIPGLRLGWRIISILSYKLKNKKKEVRTLIIGAGGAAKIIIDDSIVNKDNKNNIVVLVDDDPNKIGGTYAGLPVKGPIKEISTVIDFYNIQEVIIAISDLSQERLHEILGYLESCNVRVRRMPLLTEMASPNAKHIIDVDLNDNS